MNNLIALNPSWSQAEFTQRLAQLRQQFQQDNVKAVGLWFEDAAHFACALLACFQANVKVLLPPNLLPENQQWLAENADFLLDDQRFTHYARDQVAEPTPFVLDRHCQTEVWLKTSGSSGEAKILKKTAALLWKEAEEIAKMLPFQQSMLSVVSSVSVQHFYGLTYRVLLPLWHWTFGRFWTIGREQLVYPEYLIAESLSTPTLWITSPALLTHLNLSSPELGRCQLVGMVSSGGALSGTLGENIQTVTNCTLVECYGSTETGCIALRRPQQYWQPLQDVHIGTNEQGALWVSSGRVAGREQTADMVELFEEGFELLGRMDRIVKLGDKRISLVKIEQDLLTHSWVKDAYVAQHPHKQRAVAWVALSENGIDCLRENGRRYLIDTLKKQLAQTQEKFALPRYWRFTDYLPRNAQAKILRHDFEKICLTHCTTPDWVIQQHTTETLVLSAKIPLDLHYFKGHFANFPLVPGVVELQWATTHIEQLLQRPFVFDRVDNLKFQHFLRPNDEALLCLSWDSVKRRVKFQLKSNGEMCASGLIVEKICND